MTIELDIARHLLRTGVSRLLLVVKIDSSPTKAPTAKTWSVG